LLRTLKIGRGHSFQQPVRANFQVLGDTGKRSYGKRIAPTFDATDGFPVDTNQLRQAFLRHVGPESRFPDALAENLQDLAIGHRA
jgi:hypothetical protein